MVVLVILLLTLTWILLSLFCIGADERRNREGPDCTCPLCRDKQD